MSIVTDERRRPCGKLGPPLRGRPEEPAGKARGADRRCGLILGPAKKVAAQIKGPGANLAGLIKAIELKLEKGETIAKKA